MVEKRARKPAERDPGREKDNANTRNTNTVRLYMSGTHGAVTVYIGAAAGARKRTPRGGDGPSRPTGVMVRAGGDRV